MNEWDDGQVGKRQKRDKRRISRSVNDFAFAERRRAGNLMIYGRIQTNEAN